MTAKDMSDNTTLPPMNPQERADLEKEAGYPFVSDEQAYRYLHRKIQKAALDDAFKGDDLPNIHKG